MKKKLKEMQKQFDTREHPNQLKKFRNDTDPDPGLFG